VEVAVAPAMRGPALAPPLLAPPYTQTNPNYPSFVHAHDLCFTLLHSASLQVFNLRVKAFIFNPNNMVAAQITRIQAKVSYLNDTEGLQFLGMGVNTEGTRIPGGMSGERTSAFVYINIRVNVTAIEGGKPSAAQRVTNGIAKKIGNLVRVFAPHVLPTLLVYNVTEHQFIYGARPASMQCSSSATPLGQMRVHERVWPPPKRASLRHTPRPTSTRSHRSHGPPLLSVSNHARSPLLPRLSLAHSVHI